MTYDGRIAGVKAMIQEKNVPASLNMEQEHVNCDDKPLFPDLGTVEEEEQRRRQIAALTMRSQQLVPSSDSWRRAVGKYEETSPLNRILDRGQALRDAERDSS
jgi:hypothetical protein